MCHRRVTKLIALLGQCRIGRHHNSLRQQRALSGMGGVTSRTASTLSSMFFFLFES